MSEEKYSEMKKYYSAGVFKIDVYSAGYKELVTIAQEWAKDPNFLELIVRFVSPKNLGIQFVYLSDNGEVENMGKYYDELVEKFGKGLYAYDWDEKSEPEKHIIVMREYKNS